MKQQLRKPENWPDFETLCKKLWGEIWQCPEIKKNGRNGQNQNGIDIVGTPKGEVEYYGIQCKGKDHYTTAKLTSNEIDIEIDKALHFTPKLKKFYIATTANKDVSIEEYVRIKDLENRKVGLFEIHLYSWEDIVDLIDENRTTHNWYVKEMNFKDKYSVQVIFDNGLECITVQPSFLHITKEYFFDQNIDPYKTIDVMDFIMPNKNKRENKIYYTYEDSKEDWINPQPIVHNDPLGFYTRGSLYNKSCSTFNLTIKNLGDRAIENYKVIFQIEGEYLGISELDKKTHYLDSTPEHYKFDIYVDSTPGECTCTPYEKTLVGGDKYTFDTFCLKTLPEEYQLKLNWKLISKEYATDGILLVNVAPEIVYKNERQGTGFQHQVSDIPETFFKNNYVSKEEYYGNGTGEDSDTEED
jgi:hypothetical protein